MLFGLTTVPIAKPPSESAASEVNLFAGVPKVRWNAKLPLSKRSPPRKVFFVSASAVYRPAAAICVASGTTLVR